MEPLLRHLALDPLQKVALDLLKEVRNRLDSHYRSKRLAKLFHLPTVSLSNDYWSEFREVSKLIAQADFEENYGTKYTAYSEAQQRLEALDRVVPPSHLWTAVFGVILAVVSGVVGTLVGVLLL